MTLSAGPNLGVAALGVNGQTGMGLDITLMRGLGIELAFDDQIGLFKTFFDITQLTNHLGGDIGRLFGRRLNTFGNLIFV